MNRKQRRAMRMQGQGVGADTGRTSQEAAGRLFSQAVWHQYHGKPNEAVRLYKQVLALKADHAEAHNNLGCVLLAQGKRDAASACFERALVLMPQLFDDFASVSALLVAVNPALGEGMTRAASAWPRRLPARDLPGAAGFEAICADALLRRVLESITIRDVNLERLLTSIRLDVLGMASDAAAGDGVHDNVLGFCCALAKQCFINEYVFATTQEEAGQAERLKQKLLEALTQGSSIPALWPIEVARQYRDARVLAVDLSLSSLCYAKRKTPAALAQRIEYAQADILKLGSIDRTFDLIEVSGVLHHLADPIAGWRVLLALLRSGGFMHVGLYSELARRDIVAARTFILEQGYRPTVDDIRRCRQDLLQSPLSGVAN